MNPDRHHWSRNASFHIIDYLFRVRGGPRRPGSSGSEESSGGGGGTRAAPPPLLLGHTRNISDQSLPEEEGEGERMRTDHHHRLMEAHREEMSELRSVVASGDENAFLLWSTGTFRCPHKLELCIAIFHCSGSAWICIDFGRLDPDPGGQICPTKIQKVKKY